MKRTSDLILEFLSNKARGALTHEIVTYIHSFSPWQSDKKAQSRFRESSRDLRASEKIYSIQDRFTKQNRWFIKI